MLKIWVLQGEVVSTQSLLSERGVAQAAEEKTKRKGKGGKHGLFRETSGILATGQKPGCYYHISSFMDTESTVM